MKQDLRNRYHRDLSRADVKGLNVSALKFEAISRIRGQSGWTQIMARNQWFQREAVKALISDLRQLASVPSVLFAYSYAALEIFRYAKMRGWRTVLGQIDPGPVEEKIVADEVACEPELGALWQSAPASYWSDWREECELADQIVANSEWSKSALIKAGINGDKLSVIPLAYERRPDRSLIIHNYPDRFTRERPMRVLFLGQVNLRKGVARLLKAIRLLENEPIEFQFVGPVQISVPHDMQTNPRVRWFGAVSRSEVETFYQNADVLIFPTLSDGFGLIQLEAQAWKLPVIASKNCGDVVTNGLNGLLLEEVSEESIYEAIKSLMKNPEMLKRFVAYSFVHESFSLSTVGVQMIAAGNDGPLADKPNRVHGV